MVMQGKGILFFMIFGFTGLVYSADTREYSHIDINLIELNNELVRKTKQANTDKTIPQEQWRYHKSGFTSLGYLLIQQNRWFSVLQEDGSVKRMCPRKATQRVAAIFNRNHKEFHDYSDTAEYFPELHADILTAQVAHGLVTRECILGNQNN